MSGGIKNFVRRIYARSPFDSILSVFSKGKEAGSFIYKIIPSHELFPENDSRKVVRNDLNFKLNISHIVDWYIYFGVKEKSRQRLYSLIKKSKVFYDIGANIGDVTLNASKILNDAGTVFAFEPHPLTFKRLQNHIDLNKLKNVTAFNLGLGSSKGSFAMEEVKNNAGANRIIGVNNSAKENITINVVVLDDFVKSKNIPLPDLIKIDVEGFEKEVVIGATNIISKGRPILFIELSDPLLKLQASSAIELVQLITSLKYKIENAETNQAVTVTSELNNCHFDIIAFPI